MRVLIDTSYGYRGHSGIGVYIENLVAALRERGEVDVVEAGRPRPRPGRAGRVRNPLRSSANAALDFDWLHRALPRAAREADADVVHHPLPAHSPRIAAVQVATVHDVAFERLPWAYGRLWRTLARRQHRRAASRCQALVCVSEATARDAVGLLDAPRGKIVVAPHGPGQRLPLRERRAEPEHFLYVGDGEPRKGVDALLDLDLPLPLVLAGGAARLARGGVVGEPDPTPERLAELLAGAAALVHPSLAEGFGMTLAEAMAAGTPVVARRTPAAEELAGDAALLVEEDGLAAALRRVASDRDLRGRLSSAGRERAEAYSWSESARLHEGAYTLALETRKEAGASQ